jgi:hypothetical protein
VLPRLHERDELRLIPGCRLHALLTPGAAQMVGAGLTDVRDRLRRET